MSQSVRNEQSSDADKATSSAGTPGQPPTAVPEDKRDDSDGLGARRMGPMVMGFVDEVNGPGAAPCPDYVPTRHKAHPAGTVLGGQGARPRHGLLLHPNRRFRRLADPSVRHTAARPHRRDARHRSPSRRSTTRSRPGTARRMGEEAWNLYKHGSREERERLFTNCGGNPAT